MNRTNLSLVFRGNEKVITNLHEGTIEIKGAVNELSIAWANLTDAARLAMIVSLIDNAPDIHSFHEKVVKFITSDKFKNSID